MNPRMWRNEATRANVEALEARAWELVGPEEGGTAEGEVGGGRMSESEEIFERASSLLEKRDQLRGRRVLATAGGAPAGWAADPREPVPFLATRPAGRMGSAEAAEAIRRGADVTLVASNLSVP